MAEMILNDFIKYNSNKITEEFIQKVDKFIQSYKNKNIHLQDLLDYIVTKKKEYKFNYQDKMVKVYYTFAVLSDYDYRPGVMIQIESKETKVNKYFLMKNCFKNHSDKFFLSEAHSKINSEPSFVDFKNLLENIFYIL